MKKLLSVLLVMAVVMSFTTVMMSVSADEKEDLVAAGSSQDVETAAADGNVSVGAGTDAETTGTSGKIYLEKPSSWAGTTYYTHIWEAKQDGKTFFGFKQKSERFKEEDGKIVYDLSILDNSTTLKGGLKSGVMYKIMVYDDIGNESCGLMFNTDCIGDTIKVTSNERSFENTEDSTKHSYPIAWTENAKKYGIPLCITSVGTVQGEFVSKGSTPDDIVNAWDKNYKKYPNKASFSPQSSARDHATRLKEIKTEMTKLVSEGKVLIAGGGVYTENSSINSGSSSDSSSNSSSNSSSGSSSNSSSNSSSKKIYKDKNGNVVTKNADGSFTDANGNKVDASDVTETTETVSTGQDAMPLYIGLGVMLAAAGVYFLTRKKKA